MVLKRLRSSVAAFTATLALAAGAAQAQAPSATGGLRPNLGGAMDRPLRYSPDGEDFVIRNGAERFNRPLYGGNTAFRVDGGDRPEFVLYLPGRGGNVRLGLKAGGSVKWLHEANEIVTRYRPGSLIYEIKDPLLGGGSLRLTALAYAATEGLVLRAEAQGVAPGVELVWAYGGINGERGARDGDIGTERVPISEYFQPQPRFAEGNQVSVGPSAFQVKAQAETIAGVASAPGMLMVADAERWNDLAGLLAPAAETPARPIAVGRLALTSGTPVLLSLQRLTAAAGSELATYTAVTSGGVREAPLRRVELPPPFSSAELPARFAEAERHVTGLRRRVSVNTPDPYLNAAVGALNVGADAVWDEPQQAIMHGAIAWRAKLLGWRGPYALDALGWHDRARANFTYWFGRQNTSPIPERIAPADEDSNLARAETALHSNGDMSNSHYDMNIGFIDALVRHLAWTGDVEFARRAWPILERHLAWQRRLFRREFGPKKLPLYEAYASIWASDDVQYFGGGVAYQSAYNVFHNRAAARIARLIGQDAAPYETEAALIEQAMREHLWMPREKTFAEWKDQMGLQLVHPSAGLWNFYHTVDSAVPTPREAWWMAAAVERETPRLPVRGPGLPTGGPYAMFSTTDWMPYSWSVNNVVMGENLHTALGFWQAGRSEAAFRLMKSSLLASMYMGISPGNVGSMNYLDVYRRESQRDFADGSGVMSRALVEGLFGLRPDALSGALEVRPGFPAAWDMASLEHPDVDLAFVREGLTDTWTIGQAGERFRTVRLRLPATHAGVAGVEVNGRATPWRSDPEAIGRPAIEVSFPAGRANVVRVRWRGAAIAAAETDGASLVRRSSGAMRWWAPAGAAPPARSSPPFVPAPPVSGRLEIVDLSAAFNDRVTEIFKRGKYRSPRPRGPSLALPAQGIGAWAGHVNATAEIDDSGLRRAAAAGGGRVTTPGGVVFATPAQAGAANIAFTSKWDNYPDEASVALSGRAQRLHLLMTGSTHHMQSRIDNGEVVVTYVDGGTARLPLHNPTTWWPIEQDYFIDDHQFRRPGPIPPRLDLKTGLVRTPEEAAFKGKGRTVAGGAATVLSLPLDPRRPLRSVTVRTLANDVVIGLMSATLERPRASGGS